MKALLCPFFAFACCAGTTDAAVIFNATSSNVSLANVDNGVNSGTANSISGSTPGSLIFRQTSNSNNNNAAGFTSTSDINTLLTAASKPILAATDTVIFRLTVDSITGAALNANQVRFGMVADTSGLTPAPSVIATLSGSSGVSAASLEDGFSVTLTANSAGYTFSFDSVIKSGSAHPDITGTFTGTEFVDNFGSGHFNYSTQKFGGADTVSTISVASIEVIPEPSMTALLGLGLLGLIARRRR